jgi:hypothetical protein
MKYRNRIFTENNGNIVINCAKPNIEFIFFTHEQKKRLQQQKRKLEKQRSMLQSPTGSASDEKYFNFNG